MEAYDHKNIEEKWRTEWEKQELFRARDDDERPKYYSLIEFPYPSGNLHVGHWYAFSVPDIFARYKRMKGFNVLYPIGFDAFGLPAENAAIKNKLNPREWTLGNIEYMRSQLRSMGASFDWSREVVTCDPSYYKWTQWLFLQIYNKGLAYQKETEVNWCPSCQTVLANEQVVAGQCERCSTEVEKRLMKQWNLKITDYAPRLLSDLDALQYPEAIKEAQRNWIGASEGAELEFTIKGTEEKIRVFTTRPDTLFGATYVVLAPEHELVEKLQGRISNFIEAQKYAAESRKKAEIDRMAEGREKTGVKLEGIVAVNPANQEEIPVFIADYVLASYGTGAIMAVPAHDERDWEFAKKFNLPIKTVVEPVFVQKTEPGKVKEGLPFVEREAITAIVKHWSEEKYIGLRWRKVDWETLITGGVEEGQTPESAAIAEIREETGYQNPKLISQLPPTHAQFFHVPKNQNRFAHFHVFYFELQDGTHEEISKEEQENHEVHWLSKEEMENFHLPESHRFSWKTLQEERVVYASEGLLVNSGDFSGMNSADARKRITEFVGGELKTTYRMRDWIVSRQRYWGCPIPIIHCKTCGPVPVPDNDLPVVLPEIDDYLPTGDGKSPLAKAIDWVNVKCPKCGGDAQRETDTLDTFIDSSWYFLRYTDPKNENEFASHTKQDMWMPVAFYSGGAEHTTMHLLYSRFWHKVLFDLGLVRDTEPYLKRTNRGLILGPDGNKMSKSKGNVIDPDAVVAQLGSDTVRMYLAFIGPYNEVGSYPWSPDGIIGVRRFIERVWKMKDKTGSGELSESGERILHQTIKKVTEEIESFKFNTAVSAFMICLNALEKEQGISREAFETFLRILAPFAPHVTEELWYTLGHQTSIHKEAWPKYNEATIAEKEIYVIMQVDGKVRGKISTVPGVSQDDVLALIYKDEKLSRYINGVPLEKVIFIPNRLISIVTRKA
ncbi:leucine--tRNA ligase [Candidatus Campbellbacteria bacterium]|nr:MAG: leucine--tRNA ligase [Candidatus Campbellbacteria bacterium]